MAFDRVCSARGGMRKREGHVFSNFLLVISFVLIVKSDLIQQCLNPGATAASFLKYRSKIIIRITV
jgi:hypothetical protein